MTLKKEDMVVKSILDLPNEVIEMSLMVYLPLDDVYSFGMTGIKRFAQIADAIGEKRG